MARQNGMGPAMLGAFLILMACALRAAEPIFRQPLLHQLDISAIALVQLVFCLIMAFPLFFLRRHELRSLRFDGWFSVAFTGIMGLVVGPYLFALACRYISATEAFLLQASQPIFAVMAARILLKERFRAVFYFWGLVAIVASVMLALPDLGQWSTILSALPWLFKDSRTREIGIAYALGAACAGGLSTVFGKWATRCVSFPVTVFLRFAWGLAAIGGFVGFKLLNERVPPANLVVFFSTDPQALKAVLSLALLPGVLGASFYFAGLKKTSASQASFLELFSPAMAILLGIVQAGQSFSIFQVTSVAALLLSAFFMIFFVR